VFYGLVGKSIYENLGFGISMTFFELTILALYGLVLLMLISFGFHKYFLLYIYWKYKNGKLPKAKLLKKLPLVTIQLPVYNEKYVVKRLLKAVCELNYPKHLMEIQVLDDSTDETQHIARTLVEKYKEEGFTIDYIHREDRTGFKAGALDYGLKLAKADYVAIFDADFVPQKDFLKQSIRYFGDSKIGLVQTRWGHINRDYSLLTKIQALFLDGHFIIEHIARNRSGRFFNFNGTAGIWRKKAIEDAGGWQHDTLTEDLDLSYRAQLAGWKFIYLPDVIAPAELPVEMNAFKSQQHRWAKGSVQTAKKLIPVILKSKIPFYIKVEAVVHLMSNFTYLFMTIPSILMPVILHMQIENGWDWMIYVFLTVFFSTSLSVVFYYLVSQKDSIESWKEQIPYLPLLMSLGIGLSINNAKAVLEAMFNYTTDFKRTPKYNIDGRKGSWHNKKYRVDFDFQPVVELTIGVYFVISLIDLLNKGFFSSIPFFLLFQFGFLYIGLMSLWQRTKVISFRQLKLFFQNSSLLFSKKVL